MQTSRMHMLPLALLAAGCAAIPALADEGMWLFNQFPSERVAKAYGVRVDGAFLDHLRLASVRLNVGGSGSFVSSQGLLFTNHHVASDCIQKIGSAQHDYMKEGFYAATPAQEAPCPDLEVNVLLRMETVTSRVKEGIPAGASPDEVNRRQKAASPGSKRSARTAPATAATW